MVLFSPTFESKIKTSFSSSSYRFSIHPFPTCILLALIFYYHALNRVGVVYGFLFQYDSFSFDSLSCWFCLKKTFLCRSIFLPFTGDFWSTISLKFYGILIPRVGSWGITFWLNKKNNSCCLW